MSFNPFNEKPMDMNDAIMDWASIYPKSYTKSDVNPYTRLRVILMNGIESEAVFFSHNFHRRVQNQDLRRELSQLRRTEQQQQKRVNWLKPIDETPLENTIGYEHVAVDLTAWLAQNEPNIYVKQALDFALLEDFDHLYRYANLLDMDTGIKADSIICKYAEIMPGRPTISEFRHPFDEAKTPVDFTTAAIETKLNTLIITAGEQQTMNFYMNIGNTYQNDLGRKLYMEIGLIEEQHVTHYGSLIDPRLTWLESLLLHEYMECYLYYSFYMDEHDPNVKLVWEQHLAMEIAHLHKAAELLMHYENRHWQTVVAPTFPKLLRFEDQKAYVRQLLRDQIVQTADREGYTQVDDLPQNHTFFCYQDKVNHNINTVASHNVIACHSGIWGSDYRYEETPNPVVELQDRANDNTSIARKAGIRV